MVTDVAAKELMKREYEKKLVEGGFGFFCSVCGKYRDDEENSRKSGVCRECVASAKDRKIESDFRKMMSSLTIIDVRVEHGLYKSILLVDGDGALLTMESPFFEIVSWVR